jgi:protein subunit release factor B
MARIAASRPALRVAFGGTRESHPALSECPAKEDAMCYSKSWQADQERKQQEAKEREAQQRRAGVISDLRAQAEQPAEKAKEARDTVPAK